MDDNSKAKKIAPQLIKLREKSGLNPRQFAIKHDIDPSHYNKAERGEKSLGSDKLMELSTTFKVSLEWLMTGKDETNGGIPDNNTTIEQLARAVADGNEAAKIQARANEESARAINRMLDMMEANSVRVGASRIGSLDHQLEIERAGVEALEEVVFAAFEKKGLFSAAALREEYDNTVAGMLANIERTGKSDAAGKKGNSKKAVES